MEYISKLTLNLLETSHQKFWTHFHLFKTISFIKDITVNCMLLYRFGIQIGGKCSLSTAQLSGDWKLISIYFLKSSSVLLKMTKIVKDLNHILQ